MFYLIGGAPRTGKTTLAKKLTEQLGIPWSSTDTLESAILKHVSEKERSLKFPKSVIRTETKQSNDLMYEKYSAQEIVDAYLKQAEGLEDTIRTFLGEELKQNHSHILEGYHITPALVANLKRIGFEITSVFLGREDIDDTRKSITRSSDSNDWVISKTKNEETFEKIADMIVFFSKTIRKDSQEEYSLVDGDFMANLERILNSEVLMDGSNKKG